MIPSPSIALALLFLTGAGPQAAPQDADSEPKERSFKDSAGRERARVRETLIGFNDPSMNEESFIASKDGRRVAYMIMAGESMAVVADGVKGEVFEGIASDSLKFSADGKHFAYVGTRPGKMYAVFDGKAFEYRTVSKHGIEFAPEGGRGGWVGSREGHQYAVVDGVESQPYDSVTAQGLVFSSDGKRYAYAASSGGKFLVVADGEDGPLFDSVAGLRFTPHGHHVLYLAVREGKRFAVVDTNVYGPYDELRTSTGTREKEKGVGENPMTDVFEVSADGRRVGFVGARGKEWFVSVDGKETGPFENCIGVAISPEGSRVACIATRGEGWLLILDGVEQPGNGMQSLSFSPDGKRLASVVKRGEKRVARIDGVEGKEYDKIDEPGIRFGADGKHTAYVAEVDGERTVVVDGVEGPHFKRLGKTPMSFVPNTSRVMYSVHRGEREALVIDGVEGPPVKSYRTLTFSPDGSRYAYAAELDDDRWIAVVDGVPYGPGGKLAAGDERAFKSLGKQTPLFSLDGKRVAWVGVRDTGWVAVVDGVESRPYNLVVRTTLEFSPDGKHVAFVAAREGKKLIVVDDYEIDNGWDGFLQKSNLVWDGSHKFSIRGSRNPQYLLVEVELP
jgi:WD40 repeat protein